jgi:DNA-binding NarL/FixJ family response regulator
MPVNLITSVLNLKCEEIMDGRLFARVLVVDDSALWCRYVVNELRNDPRWQIVGIVDEGLEAVQRANELQPDLVLLDIGLPRLSGIEAARLMQTLSPNSKILFVTAEDDAAMAKTALQAGGHGYIVKTDAGQELLAGAEAVLLGKRYVSRSLEGCGLTEQENG